MLSVQRVGLVFLCLLSLSAIPALASTSPSHYHLDTWTTENGLPDNSIRALCQTRDGYLWLSTSNGLASFDGVRFRVYSTANTPALTTNQFALFALLEDRQGALWAGTERGGVLRYRNGVFSTFNTANGLPDNRILRIDEDDQGTIWIFTQSGLAQWKDNRLIRVPTEPEPATHAGSTPNLGVDRIYFGLWRVDSRGWRRFAYGQWTNLPLPPHLTDASKLQIDSIVEDAQHRLWFDLADRLDEFYCISNGRLSVFRGVGNAREDHIGYQDRLGQLLVGSHDGRVRLWKAGRAMPLPGLTTPSVMRALEDREGQLWIGSKNEGLYRLREEPITVYVQPGGPEFNAIWAILQDRQGDIWIGSTAGLEKFRNGRFTHYRISRRPDRPGSRRAEVATALYEDRDGTLWVGTMHGVTRFRDGHFVHENGPMSRISKTILAIYRDRAGNLWFGGENGLDRYRDGSLTHYDGHHGLNGKVVNLIYEDRSGMLWFGTDAGLSQLTPKGFVSFTAAQGLSPGIVVSLHEDAQGVLWVGTRDRGLMRLAIAPDGVKLTQYTTRIGLSSNSALQILEDHRGYFWIVAHNGLSRIRKQELEDFAQGRIAEIFSTPFKAAALANISFQDSDAQPSAFKAPDGKLWFATQGGLASLDPRTIPTNPNPPPVVIEEALLDGRRLDSREALRLAPGWQNLEINYSGLSFIQSNQIRFRYQLDGLDDHWTEAGTRRTAFYSHLPSGHYTFRVIAANSDGIWNQQGTGLPLIVVPPFYQTWWFLLLALCGIAAFAVLMHHHRVAKLRQAHALQEAFSRELMRSQESERQRIAAELHDSLGQNLLLIKNRAALGLLSDGDAPAAQEQLRGIAASAAHSLEEVRQIAYNLRPHHLDRLGLTQAIEAMIEQVQHSTPIQFHSDLASIDGLFTKEAEITIYRVIQESINNVIKHSLATRARVSIERDSRLVTITVRDNGRGFMPSAHPASGPGGFGLVGLAERVRILGGQHVVESRPGEGTTVSIRLPPHSLAREAASGGQ